MGSLNVFKEGLRLKGNSYVMDKLITSYIQSANGNSIILKGVKYNLVTRDSNGNIDNIMIFGMYFTIQNVC